MSLQDMARGALLVIGASIPESQVTLISDGVSVSAMSSTHSFPTGLDEQGSRGVTTGTIRVGANLISRPEKGASIIVDGKPCIVNDTSIDIVGAILVINYQYTTELS